MDDGFRHAGTECKLRCTSFRELMSRPTACDVGATRAPDHSRSHVLVRLHGRVRLALLLTFAVNVNVGAQRAQRTPPALASGPVPILIDRGARFRDLNRNGVLDRYEDWRLSSADRAADLVTRMTLEEKAGTAVHGTAPIDRGPMLSAPTYNHGAATAAIINRSVTSLLTRLSVPPATLAHENNELQRIAEGGRLGIPLTISSDPRNHFQVVVGASVASSGFSKWPETLGFGALDDAPLVKQFASVVRAEYRAVGIQMALSPQADLATDPRWARTTGTFGEDPARVGAMVRAYVEGMQGSATGVTRNGVATVVKHWVAYGAGIDGLDGHNMYGSRAHVSRSSFALHVAPFLGAFEAGAAGVMPTYDIIDGLELDGEPLEPVGAGFNAQLLTGELRGKHKFRGLVLSDWSITNDCNAACLTGTPPMEPRDIAMPWGVESLTKTERFAKGMKAGIDQFGGVDDGAPFVDAVKSGALPVARLDAAVVRILALKFELGLFENPFVDEARAAAVVGAPANLRAASRAQSRSLVILENARGAQMLPKAGSALFLHGVDSAVVVARGYRVVSDAAKADVAVLRIAAPYQTLHPTFFFGRMQHEGDLDFKASDSTLALVRATAAKTKTIVVVYLDRPAILTAIKPFAATLIGEFGISDGALLDALSGAVSPAGRLPFELPSSMEAVQAQASDMPHDSKQPLYPIGYRFSGSRAK